MHVNGTHGTQSIHLNDDDNTIIPMKVRGALCCFPHFSNDTSADIPTRFLTNPGPWEPQTFYDANDTMELVLTPTSIGYTAMHEPSQAVWETPMSKLPIEPFFMPTYHKTVTTDNKSDEQYYHQPKLAVPDDDHLFYFDPSNNLNTKSRHGHAFHLTIDHQHLICDATIDHFLNQLDDQELLRHYEPLDTLAFVMRACATMPEAVKLQPYLAW